MIQSQKDKVILGDLLEYLWIVTGSTGEYSDRCEWTVCAYRTYEEAEKHQQLAQAEADRIENTGKDHHFYPEPNKYDSRMQMDYSGTSYGYEMIELRSLINKDNQKPKP